VSSFGFLTKGQESEPRVLKAQLALAATTARNTRVTSPLWAAACAILCSVGVFGNVGFASTVFWPFAQLLLEAWGWRVALAAFAGKRARRRSRPVPTR